MDFFIETELKSYSLSQLGLSLSNKVITNIFIIDDEVVLKHMKGCYGKDRNLQGKTLYIFAKRSE